MSAVDPSPLTPEALVRRVWTFGLDNGDLFARNVVLGASGRFLHHPSPNEHRWRLEGDELVILSVSGEVSCRMRQVHSPDPDRLWLQGEHILGGPSGLHLALRETGISYPVYLTWSQAYDDFAASVPFYYSSQRHIHGVNPVGSIMEICAPAFVEPESCLPSGALLSVGAYSYCHGSFKSHSRAVIGRYCSIAGDARPFGPSHPLDRVSTSTFTYDEGFRETARRYGREDFTPIPYDQFEHPVVIGNDVWIGEDAMLRGGVRIGNGAVVAARSIVTRDVPDYAIVAGSPARVVRMRFEEALVARFLESRWWDYNFVDLPQCFDQPVAFLDALDRMRAEGTIQPWRPPKIDLADTLLHLTPTEAGD